MATGKGHRGGFNPFRKGGRFATPQSADRSSDKGATDIANRLGVANEAIGAKGRTMNQVIRDAAGHGTVTISNPQPTGRGSIRGEARANPGTGENTVRSAVTGERRRLTRSEEASNAERAARSATKVAGGKSIPEIEDMGVAGVGSVKPATRQALNTILKQRPLRPGMEELDDPYGEDIMESHANLNELAGGMLFNELNANRGRGKVAPETVRALRQAYIDAGHGTPDNMRPSQLLELLDGRDSRFDYDAVESYATSAALGMNRPEWAAIIASGRPANPYAWDNLRKDVATAAAGE